MRRATYWVAALIGILACFLGILHATATAEPAIAERYATGSLVLTFLLIFFSRGTARRALESPLQTRKPANFYRSQLEIFKSASGNSPTDSPSIMNLSFLIVEIQEHKFIATEPEDVATFEILDRESQALQETLSAEVRGRLEIALLAAKADVRARKAFDALAAHFDSAKSEAVPTAILSVFATAFSGFAGDITLWLLH